MPEKRLTTEIGDLILEVEEGFLVRVRFAKPAETLKPADSRDQATLDLVSDQIREYFAGTRETFACPFTIRGSELACALYRLLLNDVPYGMSTSYTSLGEKLGTAPRAVARMLAANPLLLIVPCHRVCYLDGRLGGYAGRADGEQLKKKLLLLEWDMMNRKTHGA